MTDHRLIRSLALMLAIISIPLALAACGGEDDNGSTDVAPSSNPTTTELFEDVGSVPWPNELEDRAQRFAGSAYSNPAAAFEVLSPRCLMQFNDPSVFEAWYVENYADLEEQMIDVTTLEVSVSGDEALVSWSGELLPFAEPDTPLMEVQDEAWVHSEGEWLWDACDADAATTTPTTDPTTSDGSGSTSTTAQ